MQGITLASCGWKICNPSSAIFHLLEEGIKVVEDIIRTEGIHEAMIAEGMGITEIKIIAMGRGQGQGIEITDGDNVHAIAF